MIAPDASTNGGRTVRSHTRPRLEREQAPRRPARLRARSARRTAALDRERVPEALIGVPFN